MRTARHSNYYESILQLRNPVGDVDDILHFAVEAVKRNVQEGIFISKKKKVTNGVDLYLSSNRFAVELGRVLYRTFGGEFKVTKKLFSQHRQTSRILYRVTVLFRLAPFKVGDFILFSDEPLKITGIVKKKVHFVNMESSKPVELGYNGVVRGFEKLAPVKVIVSKIHPHIEVLHPKTFQSVPVLPIGRDSKLVPGEKVKVLVHEEKVWRLI